MNSSIVLSFIDFHIEDFIIYLFGNGFRVGFHLLIGKSDYLEASVVQSLGPKSIGCLLVALAMIATVYLDDETVLETNEIGYVYPDYMLSAKLQTKPVFAYFVPKHLFRESLLPPVFKSESLEQPIVHGVRRLIPMWPLVVFHLRSIFEMLWYDIKCLSQYLSPPLGGGGEAKS